jgi:hypothetical protein
MRATLPAALAALVLLAGADSARACKIYVELPRTFRMSAAASKAVVYGHLANARKPAKEGGKDSGSTDLVIRAVLKADPVLGKGRAVRVPRYLPIDDPKNPPRFLVFLDAPGGKLDPFRGVPATPALVDYCKGLLAIKGKDPVKVLRYCFDYLDHPDAEVARDAHAEFTMATDQELRKVAQRLPGTRLRRWLQDPRTPRERLGLYGLLLGHCGGDRDAALLREVLEQLPRAWWESSAVLDGLLSGYAMLRPREGWIYLRALVAPSASFMVRYAGFRTIRFLDTTRPEVVDREQKLAALKVLLDQGDFADLPIEQLRRQRCWDLTEPILALYGRKSHDVPIMRRAIVRYALQCPSRQAREFVATLRKGNPDLIQEVEESLKLEAQVQVPGP